MIKLKNLIKEFTGSGTVAGGKQRGYKSKEQSTKQSA